jgi:hypothetical protein
MITGRGFSVASANAPVLPVPLNAQQSVNFTVVFQADSPGIYSAALNSVGIAVTLTATVPVQLTYQWITGTGVQSLSAGPVNFSSVPVGQSPTIEVVLLNETSVALNALAVTVTGAGFLLARQPTMELCNPRPARSSKFNSVPRQPVPVP